MAATAEQHSCISPLKATPTSQPTAEAPETLSGLPARLVVPKATLPNEAEQARIAQKQREQAQAIADQIYQAVAGPGTNEAGLAKAVGNIGIRNFDAVCAAYKDKYKKEMLPSIAADVGSEEYIKLLGKIDRSPEAQAAAKICSSVHSFNVADDTHVGTDALRWNAMSQITLTLYEQPPEKRGAVLTAFDKYYAPSFRKKYAFSSSEPRANLRQCIDPECNGAAKQLLYKLLGEIEAGSAGKR